MNLYPTYTTADLKAFAASIRSAITDRNRTMSEDKEEMMSAEAAAIDREIARRKRQARHERKAAAQPVGKIITMRDQYESFYRMLRCKDPARLPAQLPDHAMRQWHEHHSARAWYYAVGHHYTSAAERAAVRSYTHRPPQLFSAPLPWQQRLAADRIIDRVTTSLDIRMSRRRPARKDAFTRTAAIRWLHINARLIRVTWLALSGWQRRSAGKVLFVAQWRPGPAGFNPAQPTENQMFTPSVRWSANEFEMGYAHRLSVTSRRPEHP